MIFNLTDNGGCDPLACSECGGYGECFCCKDCKEAPGKCVCDDDGIPTPCGYCGSNTPLVDDGSGYGACGDCGGV